MFHTAVVWGQVGGVCTCVQQALTVTARVVRILCRAVAAMPLRAKLHCLLVIGVVMFVMMQFHQVTHSVPSTGQGAVGRGVCFPWIATYSGLFSHRERVYFACTPLPPRRVRCVTVPS